MLFFVFCFVVRACANLCSLYFYCPQSMSRDGKKVVVNPRHVGKRNLEIARHRLHLTPYDRKSVAPSGRPLSLRTQVAVMEYQDQMRRMRRSNRDLIELSDAKLVSPQVAHTWRGLRDSQRVLECNLAYDRAVEAYRFDQRAANGAPVPDPGLPSATAHELMIGELVMQ